jgi:hypothetical protein
MAKDNSIMITALPKMTKPLLPLDKYGQPLELPKPNTTNNHEQQIYRLRSRVIQANEKMLGCCKNSWPPEKNIKQV